MGMHSLPIPSLACLLALCNLAAAVQIPTAGFLNETRDEAVGTLLSRPFPVNAADPSIPPLNGNDTQGLGRTVTINYHNGWLMVGGESPGSAQGSDLSYRIFDISNPEQLVRIRPSHFGHAFTGQQYDDIHFPGDFWYVGSAGWNAHGSAQSGPDLLPGPILRVEEFGGQIRLGGQQGVPNLAERPLLYDRPSQAGPWWATMLWYGGAAAQNYTGQMQIQRPQSNANGVYTSPGQVLASFDHTSLFGGGDWHPMFFGDLLIYARSGAAAQDGVVVYRLSYHDANGDGTLDSITPQFVSSLQGGFEGYWPNLFSDGNGLHVIGSATNVLMSANITAAANPQIINGQITQGPILPIPNFTNASYPVYQDQYAFIHNRKINMTQYLSGQGSAAIELTLDEAGEGLDTSQMSLPLGNLWITGGSPSNNRSQGMGIWVHQQLPDTTRPQVSYHIPQANRSGYPRHAPLSFLLHEHPRHGGMRNGTDFAVRPVLTDDSLGAPVAGYLIHDFAGVVTFTPDTALAPETTYQVDFFSDEGDASVPGHPIGFHDAANNPIEPYSYRFSTGNAIDAMPPPVVESVIPDRYQPAPGEVFTLTVNANGTGNLQYRFNFDGQWPENWSDVPTAQHSYQNTGRHRVLVQTRDESGLVVTTPLNLLVISPVGGPSPTQSSTLVIGDDPSGRRIWVVNPDADSVSVLNADTRELITEHALPTGANPRSITRDANGHYWVTCMGTDEIRVFAPDGSIAHSLSLPYGSAPFAVAATPAGGAIFASLTGAGRLLRFDASSPASPPLSSNTFPTPRAIAISSDGSRVLVTRFISPDLHGEVGEFDGSTAQAVRTFRLGLSRSVDNGDRAAGAPNYLAGIAISPDGTRAAIVSKQDNIQRGLAYGVADLTFETTVRAVVSFLDLSTHTEIPNMRRDFDNSDSPSAVAYTPLGDTLLVTLQGNNRIVGIDALSLTPLAELPIEGLTLTSPAVLTLDAFTGLAPQGLLIDPEDHRIFVQNFMGRSVSAFDAGPLLENNHTVLPLLEETETVFSEPLASEVLAGKQIFYNAGDPRMSRQGYISCATCHVDGGHDGRVWDFTGRGEGLRRTTDLRGRGGMEHGNVHWSGNFDEIQDFEHDIRNHFGGLGFLNDEQFATNHPGPQSVKSNLAGGESLDALAAYVASLDAASVPRSPHRQADGTLTAAAQRGREQFAALSCNSCHAGDDFTNSQVHDIDTFFLSPIGSTSPLSGQRLGGSLEGIDTPTLMGLHAQRTYLHHGEASSLAEVFDYAGGVLLQAEQAEWVGDGPTNPSAIIHDIPSQGGGGELRGVLGGSFVEINGAPGTGIRFSDVDGGTGGQARLSIRHMLRGAGTTRLVINGVEQATLQLLPQLPNQGWTTGGWRWLHTDVYLQAGENTIEILRGEGTYANFHLDAILVANSSILATAQPHRVLRDSGVVSMQQRGDLLAYLSQLDGSPAEAPPVPNPGDLTVTIAATAGQPGAFTRPYAELDITFSRPASGLEISDLQIGGSSGHTAAHLIVITENLHYRLRIAGFQQSGSLTAIVPASAALAIDDASPSLASNFTELSYMTTISEDDIAPLSDEFQTSTTISQWQRNYVTEGWTAADKLQTWDINTSRPGHMRLMPYTSSWFQNYTGALAYKEITGDFIITLELESNRRNGQAGRPTSDYSLSGIMIRSPRPLHHAAPVPDPGPQTVLPWPPDASYTTAWAPGTENYIFLSYGYADSNLWGDVGGGTWYNEVKSTTNSVSNLYAVQSGIPAGGNRATLQAVRVGQTFLLLRRHGPGQPWIVENRFVRNDMPATLQVGITAYTDWNNVSIQNEFHHNRTVNTGGNPDLVADIDFFRLRRPAAELTEPMLGAALVTRQAGELRWLTGTALEPYLGDHAISPYTPPPISYDDWLMSSFTADQLVLPHFTDRSADPDNDGHGNLLEYALGSHPNNPTSIAGPSFQRVGNTLTLTYPRIRENLQYHVEASTNLIFWDATGVDQDPSTPLGQSATATLVIPSGTPRVFLRLRVEEP